MWEGDNEEFKICLAAFFSSLRSNGRISKESSKSIYRAMHQFSEDIVRIKRQENVTKTLDTLIESSLSEVLPEVTTMVYQIGENAREEYLVDCVKILRQELQNPNVTKKASSVNLSYIVKHVYKKHGVDPDNPPPEWRCIDVASDGVTPAGSATWKHHVVAVSFLPCGKPYPWHVTIVNKRRGGKLQLQSVARVIVQAIKENGLKLIGHIADAQERKWIKGLASTGCAFSCEFCLMRGITLAHKVGIILPWPHVKHPPRTLASVKKHAATAKRIKQSRASKGASEKVVNKIHYKGVKERSAFADLSPGYNMIKDSPLDTMHLLALGMSKKIYLLIFEPGKRKKWGETKRKTQEEIARLERQTKSIDDFMRTAKVPNEFGRRTREVDSSNYKASEWRYMGMYAFLYIACKILSEEEDKEYIEILQIFSYMYRVVNLDEADFSKVENEVDLDEIMERMAYLYEKNFGEENCTFNEHNFFIHLLDHRRRFGPLYKFSAWRFEDLYGQMERCYRPGTPHEGKQLFRGFFVNDLFSHRCHWKKPITVKCTAGTKSDDSLLVARGDFYRVVAVTENNDSWICKKMKAESFTTEIEGNIINWKSVGVRRLKDVSSEGEAEEETVVASTEIVGKGLIVGNLLMEAKIAWLME